MFIICINMPFRTRLLKVWENILFYYAVYCGVTTIDLVWLVIKVVKDSKIP